MIEEALTNDALRQRMRDRGFTGLDRLATKRADVNVCLELLTDLKRDIFAETCEWWWATHGNHVPLPNGMTL